MPGEYERIKTEDRIKDVDVSFNINKYLHLPLEASARSINYKEILSMQNEDVHVTLIRLA